MSMQSPFWPFKNSALQAKHVQWFAADTVITQFIKVALIAMTSAMTKIFFGDVTAFHRILFIGFA